METAMQLPGVPMDAVKLSATGLTFSRDLSFDEWTALGERLRSLGNAVQFWIGDWIRYGEHKFGEKYKQAIEATGYEAGTLRDCVWVAEHVEMSRRRDKLPFSHHREVAALKPAAQSLLLDMAERNGLTREQLRREVRALQQVENPKPQPMRDLRAEKGIPEPEKSPTPTSQPEPAMRRATRAHECPEQCSACKHTDWMCYGKYSDPTPEPEPEPVELEATRYMHPEHGELFVDCGIGGQTWGTFFHGPYEGSTHRLVSPALPMFADIYEAQRNLDSWAAAKRLPRVETGSELPTDATPEPEAPRTPIIETPDGYHWRLAESTTEPAVPIEPEIITEPVDIHDALMDGHPNPEGLMEYLEAQPATPTPEPEPTGPTEEEITHGERLLRSLIHPGMGLYRSLDGTWTAFADSDVEGLPSKTAIGALQSAMTAASTQAVET